MPVPIVSRTSGHQHRSFNLIYPSRSTYASASEIRNKGPCNLCGAPISAQSGKYPGSDSSFERCHPSHCHPSDPPSTPISERSASSTQTDLCHCVNLMRYWLVFRSLQAMAVMAAPAVAPASPKHAMVDKVGVASLVFAITRGELPVA